MMNSCLLAALSTVDLWYALPLIVAVSLVYSATRHEETGAIMIQSLRTGVWIACFMTVVFVIIMIVAWLL